MQHALTLIGEELIEIILYTFLFVFFGYTFLIYNTQWGPTWAISGNLLAQVNPLVKINISQLVQTANEWEQLHALKTLPFLHG